MKTFQEVQRFRQWWIWTIVGVAFVGPALVLLLVILPDEQVASNDAFILAFAVVFGALPIVLLFTLRLETAIDETSLRYRFFPVHRKWRNIPWSEIEEIYVRDYEPLWEYGGWGIRVTFGKGIALNVAGKKGIQCVLKNGKRILIGTQKAEEIQNVLDSLRSPVLQSPVS